MIRLSGQGAMNFSFREVRVRFARSMNNRLRWWCAQPVVKRVDAVVDWVIKVVWKRMIEILIYILYK